MVNQETDKTTLVLKGTPSDFDQIIDLFQSGELEKLVGLPVESVDVVFQKERENSTFSLPIRISQWFQRIATTDWNYEFALMGTLLSYQTRGNQLSPIRNASVPETEGELQDSSHQQAFQSALSIAEEHHPSSETIADLVEALGYREHDEVYWQTALTLGTFDCSHPLAAVAQRKELSIGNHLIELFVALQNQNNGNYSILLQLYSTEDYYLPDGVSLTVLKKTGECLGQLNSTAQDCYLSLELSQPVDEAFLIRVVLQEETIEESFLI